jgi:hypothetical protein
MLLIVGLAVPPPLLAQPPRATGAVEPQPATPADNRIDARAVFEAFRRKHPGLLERLDQEAAARGWQPTDHFEGFKERTQPGTVRVRPIGGMQNEYMNGWDGDISIWYWQDSNTANVEYRVITRSYQTGEDLIVEGSFRPYSDHDGQNDWFEVRGGDRWGSLQERTRQGFNEGGRLLQVAFGGALQTATEQRRCMRRCLSQKIRNVLISASVMTGGSLVHCGRAAAMSGIGFGIGFFGCVGVAALVGTGGGLVHQFMIADDCKTQCGV